jgi:hypothetical protein
MRSRSAPLIIAYSIAEAGLGSTSPSLGWLAEAQRPLIASGSNGLVASHGKGSSTMADEPHKIEVDAVGCLPWTLYFTLLAISFALYAIANAIKGLHCG